MGYPVILPVVLWNVINYLIQVMERNHLEDLGADRIILKWIFRKWDGTWID
jgi:hypothetical protein